METLKSFFDFLIRPFRRRYYNQEAKECTAECDNDPSIANAAYVAIGEVSSFISQQDAEDKAQALCVQKAIDGLIC